MDICFYVENIKSSLDYSKLEYFNPGLGGTQYLFLEVATYLACNSNYTVHLFSNTSEKLEFKFDYDYVRDVFEAIEKCSNMKYDILVIRGPIYNKKIVLEIEKKNVKTIIWSHNFESYNSIKMCEKSQNIVKYVCVGNEQRDLLLDTKLYNKSCTIWNGLNFEKYPIRDVNTSNKCVCYIGNLYPKSGYDKFAKAWIEIEKKIPEVELYIIGGNNLYSEKAFNGRYSKRSINRLAKIVERAFYIDGELKKNVHFTGVLGGHDKLEIMQKASVGVANITESGETFGLSLIEFEALGVPVVSIKYRGTRETVCDRYTGILVKKNHLENGIVELLQDNKLANQMEKNAQIFVKEHFDIKVIGKKWIELFDQILNGSSTNDQTKLILDKFHYDGKSLIKFNYKIKKHKWFSWLPSVSFYRYIYAIIFRVLEKLNLY